MPPSSTLVGRIVAISISKKKGVPKTNVSSARLIENYGIEGDAHAGSWHRQVSLLALESLENMRQRGLPKLRPGALAENITVAVLPLSQLSIGTKLRLGAEAILEVTQIGKDCDSKCAIFTIVGDCVLPREGVFARVLRGGNIAIGDPVEILSEADESIVILNSATEERHGELPPSTGAHTG